MTEEAYTNLAWLFAYLGIATLAVTIVYILYVILQPKKELPAHVIMVRDLKNRPLFVNINPHELDLTQGVPDYSVAILGSLYIMNPVYICSRDFEKLGVPDADGKVEVLPMSNYIGIAINADYIIEPKIIKVVSKYLKPVSNERAQTLASA